MRDLLKEYEECLKDVKDAGIETGKILGIVCNKHLKRTWGRCKIEYDKDYPDEERFVFTIEINKQLLEENIEEMALKNTIVHEILHTCDDCFNHGAAWKEKADIMNNKYPKYNIKRLTTFSEKNIEFDDRDFNYVLQCQSCGRKYGYYRMSKAIKNPHLANCWCGGAIKRLK